MTGGLEVGEESTQVADRKEGLWRLTGQGWANQGYGDQDTRDQGCAYQGSGDQA